MIALTLLLLLACGEQQAVAPAAAAVAAVRTAPVEAILWTPEEELSGSLEPVSSVQLGFDLPGRVEALIKKRGDTVRAGDAIARLDSRLASAQLAQAEAAWTGAKAQVEAAQAALARLEKLREAGGVSDQQYTEVRAQVRAAEAGLEQAGAAVRLARTQVSMHTLKSPIAGVVTNGPDNAGIMIGAGTPLFVIEDLSTLQIKTSAPESASWITPGQPVRVQSGSVTLDSTVFQVIPALDPATRRIPIEIRIDNPPPTFRSHAFVRATISGTARSVFSVPKGAVVARPDFSVFVQNADGTQRVPVQVLKETDTAMLIDGALSAGAMVVVDPPHGFGSEEK